MCPVHRETVTHTNLFFLSFMILLKVLSPASLFLGCARQRGGRPAYDRRIFLPSGAEKDLVTVYYLQWGTENMGGLGRLKEVIICGFDRGCVGQVHSCP